MLLLLRQLSNGGCSHECLPSQDGKGRKCGCPDDLVLSEDEKTCIPQPSCPKDQFQCKSGKVECIPEVWICDGVAECSDKSDEENCPECPATHYRCPDSRHCLPPTKVCDNSPDCPDASDELCCGLEEFVCRPENRKECIHTNYVCDGNVDCKNSADEEAKNCRKSVADKTITITNSHPENTFIVIPISFLVLAVIVGTVIFFRKRRVVLMEEPDILLTHPRDSDRYPDCRSLGKDPALVRSRLQLNPSSCPVQRSTSDHVFDRSIVTGASSTSSSANHFPKETLNPPPSPATDRSQCHYDTSCSSHSATRPSSHAASLVLFPGSHSMHKRLLLRGPPTTPCSNDPNEESEYYGTVPYSYSNSQVDYDIMYPPLTTPLNVSEASTPPSPCTERSYFRSNPYPNPPPSPDPSNHP